MVQDIIPISGMRTAPNQADTSISCFFIQAVKTMARLTARTAPQTPASWADAIPKMIITSDKLVKIAETLGISFGELAARAMGAYEGNFFVTGFAQRGYIEYHQHGFAIQSLSPPGASERDFFVGIMTIKPFKELKKWKFRANSSVCLFVESGTLEITYGNHVKKIHSNESAYFDGGVPHKLRNVDSIEARLLLVTRPPLH